MVRNGVVFIFFNPCLCQCTKVQVVIVNFMLNVINFISHRSAINYSTVTVKVIDKPVLNALLGC